MINNLDKADSRKKKVEHSKNSSLLLEIFAIFPYKLLSYEEIINKWEESQLIIVGANTAKWMMFN